RVRGPAPTDESHRPPLPAGRFLRPSTIQDEKVANPRPAPVRRRDFVTSSRYVVGIDLGTTNSALAYVDTGVPEGQDIALAHLPIPQVVHAGTVEERPLLPSSLYLPGPNEQPAGSLRLPWDPDRDYAVGEFARTFGSQVPTRLVASAKSWLSYPGVDRR